MAIFLWFLICMMVRDASIRKIRKIAVTIKLNVLIKVHLHVEIDKYETSQS